MQQSVFERHPRATLTLIVMTILVFFGISAEIFLRFIVPYNIGYYMAVQKKGVYHYPYGDMKINSMGFFDDEFDLSGKKPRIGYMGDSIIVGVGAGSGFRISDLLEKHYPRYDHWTFGVMGNGLREDLLLSMVDEYQIDKIIYGFNLNDFLPPVDQRNQPTAGAQQSLGEKIVQSVYYALYTHLDWLRGKSYLYTVTRTAIKNILVSMGYGHTGFKAIELYPTQNEEIIRTIAERFNALAQTLSGKGVDFCLIIFPYEMQISQQAAKTYQDLGIHWEAGFEHGLTQKIFMKYLTVPHIYDALHAFDNFPDSPTGTYFVYNKGDKIDFNHPNRAGHSLITAGLTASENCGFLDQ